MAASPLTRAALAAQFIAGTSLTHTIAQSIVAQLPQQANLGATTFPTVNDDTSLGYDVGSLWIDINNDNIWMCVSSQIGSAIWAQMGRFTAADETKLDNLVVLNGSLVISSGGTGLTVSPTFPLILNSAGGMGTTTSGGGDGNQLPEQAESSTNKVNYHYLAMATGESVFWNISMPINWDGAALVSATMLWAAGSGSDDVKFEVKGRGFGNGDALDTALGSTAVVEDTLITAEDVHITSATTSITLGGPPSAGEFVVIEVKRVAPAGTDLAVDLRLLGVRLAYTASGYTE